ncbi:MAG TPA: hypothetical protein VIH09_00165 [Flavobacterium sp.]|uniref:hypothetical protein n=1 Tax=Flavobacterium sp. TaxID=239 RepID=UPI002F3EA951
MKKIKYFLSAFLLLSVLWSCANDDFGTIDFVGRAVAPTNVSALYDVTQDNTGLVTITPNGEGAVSYDIYYGDDTVTAINVVQGQSTTHVYEEGTYSVKIVAIGVNGLKTEVTQSLVVSFKAPENLVVTITNDLAISKQVNVTATADYATMFDVYFGEAGNDEPVSANIGETASYTYKEAGTYTIRVVAKSAAIQTTEQSESFAVTAILQPTTSAPTQTSRQSLNVISIFSSAYTNVAGSNYNPDWGQSSQGSSYALFDLNGDKMLNYIKLSYQGISIGQTIDVSNMEYLHMDVWTADGSKIETSLINGVDGNSTEKPVVSDLTKGEWTSIDIPISAYTSQGLSVDQIFQLKFVGTPWAAGTVFIDNLYFYKAAAPSSGLEGTWKLAPEAGALKVGPSAGNGDWWTSDMQAVTDRACLFDDTYVFSSNGSFNNVLGTDTWLEAWQGTGDACGIPVTPYDGTAVATYLYDAVGNTITINGKGAYLGIPKANNAGELPNVAVPNSITYNVTLTDNGNTMNLVIETGSGVFWSFKLVKV